MILVIDDEAWLGFHIEQDVVDNLLGLLEKCFDKVAQDGGWHHQRLQGMPPLGAITVVGQDAYRLRKTAADFLAAGQVTSAEPLLRQYLEFSLWRVIDKVEIPVPIDLAIRDEAARGCFGK
jgi:hypothetical protein